jgi:hypothetical protein
VVDFFFVIINLHEYNGAITCGGKPTEIANKTNSERNFGYSKSPGFTPSELIAWLGCIVVMIFTFKVQALTPKFFIFRDFQ